MLYVKMKNDVAVDVLNDFPGNDTFQEYESRGDWKTFESVTEVAAQVSEFMGETYLPVDNGLHHYPRYDVARKPRVGDEVSYAFNGDSYPDGVIVSVGDGVRAVVKTSTGRKFNRVRKTGSWMNGNTWSLVNGHYDKRNPSF